MAETGLAQLRARGQAAARAQDVHLRRRRRPGRQGLRAERRRRRHAGQPATGDKDSTLKIEKVTVEALDFERMKERQDRRRAALRQAQARGHDRRRGVFTLLDPYGIPRCRSTWCWITALDRATKVLRLSTSSRSRCAARARCAALARRRQRQGERSGRRQGRRPAAHRLADRRRHRPARQAAARGRQGAGPDARGLVRLALVSLAAFCEGQGAPTLKALDAVASFVGDWQAPKGPLVVGLPRPRPRPWPTSTRSWSPTRWSTLSGSARTYPATRDGAAKAGPAIK